MIFRQYDSDVATINEWARQLTSVTRKYFRRYEVPENTLTEWASMLNELNTGYSFTTYETINDWEKKLNMIFN